MGLGLVWMLDPESTCGNDLPFLGMRVRTDDLRWKHPRLVAAYDAALESSKWEITDREKRSDGKTRYALTHTEAFVTMQFRDKARILVDPNGNVIDVSVIDPRIRMAARAKRPLHFFFFPNFNRGLQAKVKTFFILLFILQWPRGVSRRTMTNPAARNTLSGSKFRPHFGPPKDTSR